MVIGIDASRANKIQKTGTEWYSYHLIQELKKIIPDNIRVILYSKEPLQGGLEDLPSNWQSKVLNWPPKFLWTQIRLSLEMLFKRPDVLFIPAHTIPLIHPKKTILVAHDIGFATHKELYSDKELGYHRWAMNYAIKKAHHLISVSEFSKNEIIKFYKIPESKISFVHNGFTSKDFFPLPQPNPEILNKYNIKKPYLLFIGRKEEKKNIPRLINAFALLPKEYNLVLVGGEGYKYEQVQANIKKHNLENRIIEPGYVDQEDINAIMNQAEAFIFPSLYEGFGIPVLEAMSAGTPVICSHIPPLKEVAGQAAFYFDPYSIEDMAQTITKNINNTALKEKGFAQIKKFSWSKCAQETWKIINKNI